MLGSHDLASGNSITYRNTPMFMHTHIYNAMCTECSNGKNNLETFKGQKEGEVSLTICCWEKGKWSETFLTGNSKRARDKVNFLECKIWRAVNLVSLKLAGEKNKLFVLFILISNSVLG